MVCYETVHCLLVYIISKRVQIFCNRIGLENIKIEILKTKTSTLTCEPEEKYAVTEDGTMY
jgi:hypothetical protein